MTKVYRTVWRSATTDRDLLQYDAQRDVITVPALEINQRELYDLHQATGQLLAELVEPPAPPTPKPTHTPAEA